MAQVDGMVQFAISKEKSTSPATSRMNGKRIMFGGKSQADLVDQIWPGRGRKAGRNGTTCGPEVPPVCFFCLLFPAAGIERDCGGLIHQASSLLVPSFPHVRGI
jgi:hypothetical protein